MAKNKNQAKFMNIFEIVINSFGLYFKNLPTLSKVMYFPVFGQLLGIIIIFSTTLIYAQNMQNIIKSNPFFNNALAIFIVLLFLTIPGFVLFLKAFWEYLIATISLNSIILSINTMGEVSDIHTHTNLVKSRSKEYIILLTYLALIWIIALVLPFVAYFINMPAIFQTTMFTALLSINIFIGAVLSVFLSLSYQVFAFNEHLKAFEVLKRSYSTVKGNFIRLIFLAIITGLVTTIIYPTLINYILESVKILNILAIPVQGFVQSLFPDPKIFSVLSMINVYNYSDLALTITAMITGSIITAMLLPWSSACYTLMYFDIENRRNAKMAKDNKK